MLLSGAIRDDYIMNSVGGQPPPGITPGYNPVYGPGFGPGDENLVSEHFLFYLLIQNTFYGFNDQKLDKLKKYFLAHPVPVP